jgi:putative pyoverdin transport system ATP-binding/permease protein
MTLARSLLRSSWRILSCAVAAGLVSGLSAAALIALLHTALEQRSAHGGPLVLAFVGLALLSVFCKGISETILTRLGQRTIGDMRRGLGRGILEAPLRELEVLGQHRLLAALNDDALAIAQAYVLVPHVCVGVATVLGCVAYVGLIAPAALVVLLGALALGIALFRLHEGLARASFQRSRETSDTLFRHFRALTLGVKELKLNRSRREAFLLDSLGRSLSHYEREFVAGMNQYSIATGWGSLLFHAALGVTVFVLPTAGGLSGAAAAGATLALLYAMGPVAQLVEIAPVLSRALVAARKLDALGLTLRSTPEKRSERESFAPWRQIELRSVAHSYYGEQNEASFRFGPLDLQFEPGEIVLLAGGNGSGKTTLALLLLGLYVPESGAICVDGVAVDAQNRERYRQLFSATFAEFHVFEEQLGLTDAAMAERARRFIQLLKLERRVTIENGALRSSGLSTGQRKRVALLAALLEDRSFYLFDEWAADQDPEFRKIFYREFLPELRRQGKTALVISHDEQYFDVADRCLRMERGVLTELPAAVWRAARADIATHVPGLEPALVRST